MKSDTSSQTALQALLASRPRSFRRSYLNSVWFWLFLFIAIGFLINTIVLIVQGAVMYAMIGVTSSQIAYNYNVSEAEIMKRLVASVHPFHYKIIAYSAGLSWVCFFAASRCRKLVKRAQYTVALEKIALALDVPPAPSAAPPLSDPGEAPLSDGPGTGR